MHAHSSRVHSDPLSFQNARFPETWTVNGHPAKFESTLGQYSSSSPQVAQAHIDAMNYSYIDLSIASWWGPETNLDRARLTMLMDETIKMNSSLKWTVYYEQERVQRPGSVDIRQDLDYLKKWFTWHPAWAHINGRPLIFVYNMAGCDVVKRWMDASDSEWYVVLKIFGNFLACPQQPDDWVSNNLDKKRVGLDCDSFHFHLSSTNTEFMMANRSNMFPIPFRLHLAFGGPIAHYRTHQESAGISGVRMPSSCLNPKYLGT